MYKTHRARCLPCHKPSDSSQDPQHHPHIRGWPRWSKQLFFLFLIFSLTPADLHLVPGLTGTWQMRLGRGVGRAQGRKRKGFYNILRYSERRSQGFFLTKKIPAGSQSYIYAKQARKPSRPPEAGNEPNQGHCVQATGWLRGHC